MTASTAAKFRCLLIAFLIVSCCTSKAQVVANFTGAPVSGCAPLVVNFTDLSTGTPNQWKWDLGNGTISFLQNPSVTYFNPGQYDVKLIVRNAANNADSITKTQFITVFALPTVTFNASATTGCFPLHVQFTDQSVPGDGTIVSWIWDFGDGNASTVQNPSHTYLAPGNYNVSLQIKNSNGCTKTLTIPQYIQISSGVHADFTNTTPSSCSAPVTINFTNTSAGTGTLNYQWNFGDGNTSVQQNPSHTYLTPGSYNVQLIVTNSGGCTDTIIKQSLITIGNVHASFTSIDSVCENTVMIFNNTSSPTPTSQLWLYGDGSFASDFSPAKTYSSAGTYVVKLISNFGGCLDSATKIITVLPKPTADFNAPVTSSCKPPLNVQFNNLSTGGSSYAWDFGDGNSSTQSNPSHIYTATGGYTVTLTVTNSYGCSKLITKPNFVIIQGPSATINGLVDKGCVPLTHLFTSTVNTVDPVVSWHWDFGDGTTSTLPTPYHIYTVAGVYDIQLVITTAGGCTDTVNVQGGIVVGSKPIANFSANPLDACAKIPITFTDLSTGNVVQWLWNFGDGGTSIEQNPVHLYSDTGYFTVTLVVWNNGCADTIKFVNYIHIKPPIANFDYVFNCGTKSISFTDRSIGADQWDWNFGDGDTSTQQSPTHLYTDTGNFLIKLTVFNISTGCDYSAAKSLRLVDEKALFYASDTVICKGNDIAFTQYVHNNLDITSLDWNFGDGANGSGFNPHHVYTHTGVYDVQLILTDINGCKDTLNKPQYIIVNGPTADFSSVAPGSCLNSGVVFNDNSVTDGTHPLQTWIWNYGDGITDTLNASPFLHTYLNPGIYSVSLKIIDSVGCADSISKSNFFTISKPVADFYSPDTANCPNHQINFTSTSTGPSLTYTWDFGDGTTDNVANPVHNYLVDGIYTVKLLVVDQYGCSDSVTKLTYIKIAAPLARFTMSDSVSTCPPLVVNFTNTSVDAVSTNWDFGDGTFAQISDPSHFYSYSGTFHVKLTVTGPGGCTDTMTKVIIVRGPTGSFVYNPYQGCKPLTVNFTATTLDKVAFIWDYNDGSVLSTPDSVVTHTYTIPGNYLPRMILVDSGGCQVPILGTDTVRVTGVAAKFGFNTQGICDAGIFNFTDSSATNDVVSSYAWDFGDGGTSGVHNPSHYYAASGLYYPTLIVRTQSGCSDTSIASVPVKIVSSPQANVIQTPNGCVPLTITFNANLSVPDTSAIIWKWTFGNGDVSSVQNPPAVIYTSATLYQVQLIASNSSGCSDTVHTTVDAYYLPAVKAGIDTMICKGIGVTLHATGAVNYNWSPTTGLSCNNCANPVATPDSLVNYIVTGSTATGCLSKDTVQVKVKYPFVMNVTGSDTLCVGGSTHLAATGASTYVWSPSTGLSSTTNSNIVASPRTSMNYMVIGKDDHNCFKDTGYASVKIYPIPTVDAGPDKTINAGMAVDLIPIISNDVTNVLWSPTGTIFRNVYPGITVKPTRTTEYTVQVTNPGGCKAIDKVTVYVICNGSNVFIPNTFSPNGDGANDVFYPRGTGLFSIKTLRVFNRWGEVVFESTNFTANDASKGWDGTFKGAKLLPDVYVYTMDIICDNSTILTFKGDVALIQ